MRTFQVCVCKELLTPSNSQASLMYTTSETRLRAGGDGSGRGRGQKKQEEEASQQVVLLHNGGGERGQEGDK